MLIKLINFNKLSALAARANHRFNTRIYTGNQRYFFGNKGKYEETKSEDTSKNDRPPTVIEISKQQFVAMKQFVENMKLSMPTPNITPFVPSQSSKPNSASSGITSPPRQSQKPVEQGEAYFSSQQHILSFKLLKLSEPQQFGPIFNDYKSRDNVNLKLIILYRYICLGGTIDKTSLKVQHKLANQYLMFLTGNMAKFQQHELQQFLQLYLNLHRTQKGSPTLKQPSLPRISLVDVENALPLIKQPSGKNSRVLMLLLKFWETQFENTSSKPVKEGMKRILNHYKLQNLAEDFLQPQYPLNEIAYIGVWAYFCDMQQYNAMPMFIQRLKSINQSGPQIPLHTKKIIKTVETILQSLEGLTQASAKIMGKFDELTAQLAKYIENQTKQPLSLSKREELHQKLAEQVEDKILEFNGNQNSGQISSLLHSCLLAILEKPNAVSLKVATPLVQIIIHNISTYLGKTPFLPLTEYSEYWQSCMIMFKLAKAGNPSVKEKDLYKLLSCFIGKINVQDCIKSTLNEETGAVIQQLAEDVEKRLFEALVGFRIIVPANLNLFSSANQKEITEINLDESVQKNKNALRELLTGYRTVIENMYKCGLITNHECSQVHNLVISCMIGQAYVLQNSQPTTPSTYIKLLLSPTVKEILAEFGTGQTKYGQYVKKVLSKYNEK